MHYNKNISAIKRKRWSNSTNINKLNNYFSSLNTKTNPMTYVIGNPVPDLGQAQKCGEGIPTLPSCTGSPTSIHIYTNDKKNILQRFISTQKDHADAIET